jgi:hypothetical protein
MLRMGLVMRSTLMTGTVKAISTVCAVLVLCAYSRTELPSDMGRIVQCVQEEGTTGVDGSCPSCNEVATRGPCLGC